MSGALLYLQLLLGQGLTQESDVKLPFPLNTVLQNMKNEKQFQELWGENWREVNCSSCCQKRRLRILTVAVKFSLQLSLQCCSALEPFPWSKTSLVSTIFFPGAFTVLLQKDVLPPLCVFWCSVAVKGDCPVILHVWSVGAASFSLLDAAHRSVH